MSDRNRADAATARDQSSAPQDLRQRAIDAYDSARGRAADAGRSAGDAIDDAPLVALAAGMAAGALLAALLPVTRKEREFAGPYGEKVKDAAREAARTARRVAPDKLRELGLTPDSMVGKAGEAVRETAEAALGKFRREGTGR